MFYLNFSYIYAAQTLVIRMRNYHYKILVIDPLFKTQKVLLKLFKVNNFSVDFGNNANEGIQLAINNTYSLIICQKDLEDQNGFHVFKMLENYLSLKNTSFFLLIDKVEKDDFLIGLEMGIDNFILTPIDNESVINKINNDIKKFNHINIFESKRFQTYFANSLVAMFIIENKAIVNSNSVFSKLFDIDNSENLNIPFNCFFGLNGNAENALNFRKLENGLIDHCYLKNVKYTKDLDLRFDLYLSSNFVGEEGKIIAELLPSDVESVITIMRKLKYDQFNFAEYTYPKKVKQENGKINLTKRENEIFKLSAQGLPIKLIASKLCLSGRTIEKHRSNIMGKIGVHSIIEAILKMQNN